MALTTLRDPFFSDLAAMEERITNLFDQDTRAESKRRWSPATDIVETEEDYVVLVDLPGMSSDEVAIELDGDVLTISGERGRSAAGTLQRIERPIGGFSRSFSLSKGFADDGITATFSDGVLQVRIPKPADQKPRRIAPSKGHT